MKKMTFSKATFLLVLAAAILLSCYPNKVNAQNEPAFFAIIDFMKVKPENEAKYLDVEKNIWKPLHQARADQGMIEVWGLYRVLYTGTDDPYNYVTVTLYRGSDHLEDPWAGIDPAKILTGRNYEKDMEETGKSRELVKSQLITMLDEVVPESRTMEDKYLVINYMKVKPENATAYQEVEKSIWRPIHEQFIKAGSREGWSLWSNVFPTGSAMEYQYLTADYVLDFTKIGMADYNAAFGKAHAGQDMQTLEKKTMDSRELVRTELWQVVDEVMKE